MVTGGVMREILLHGSSEEAFDRSLVFARRLAESFQARLHVVYTVEDPLSAGWTAEVSADKLPEIHQAMEEEARERLARVIPLEDQDRLGVEIDLRGPRLSGFPRDGHDTAVGEGVDHVLVGVDQPREGVLVYDTNAVASAEEGPEVRLAGQAGAV